MGPFYHLIFPVAILLAVFRKINIKKALLLAPLTFIMDFDLFIPEMHRILFHNILFALIIIVIIAIFWDIEAVLISAFYLFSHLIMDLQGHGAAYFYPFYDKFISLKAELIHHNSNWILNFKFITEPQNIINFNYPSYYLTTEMFSLILLTTIAILLGIYFKFKTTKLKTNL